MKGKIIRMFSAAFACLIFFTCPVFLQENEQMLASSSGKYCRVKTAGYEQRYDTLEIRISVEWINEDLQPLKDFNARLLLRKGQITSSAEGKIKYLDFQQRDFISFNHAWPLRILVNKDFTGTQLQFDFNFEIDEGQGSDPKTAITKPLLFKSPGKFSCLAPVDLKQLTLKEIKPPEIRLISPKADADNLRIVKETEVDIIGYATDASGINLVLVNSNDARMYPDGKFVSTVKLAPGENEIRISAIDNDGAITEQRISVLCDSYEMASQMLNAG